MKISRMRLLWLLTLLFLAGLVAATAALAERDKTLAAEGYNAYVAEDSGTVYLRQEPRSSSRVVAALQEGQPLYASRQQETGGMLWVFVHSERAAGWLPVQQITTDPPR